jgi:hypothetical protein
MTVFDFHQGLRYAMELLNCLIIAECDRAKDHPELRLAKDGINVVRLVVTAGRARSPPSLCAE